MIKVILIFIVKAGIRICILHHKDSTGAEIQVSLIDTIRKHPNIDLFENHFAIEVLTQHHLGKL